MGINVDYHKLLNKQRSSVHSDGHDLASSLSLLTNDDNIKNNLNNHDNMSTITGDSMNDTNSSVNSVVSDSDDNNKEYALNDLDDDGIIFKGCIEVIEVSPHLSLSESCQDEYVLRMSIDGTIIFADHR